MREIKFKIWNAESELMSGERSITDLFVAEIAADCPASKRDAIKDFVWLQFTGLQDKNGKDIYEGDIVSDGGKTREIKWRSQAACFYLSTGHRYKDFFECAMSQSDGPVTLDEIEVIGNIYQNPSLLPPTTK